jgi:hypothetical protein
MALFLPVRLAVVRLPRGKCPACGLIRILFTVTVEHEVEDNVPLLSLARLTIDGTDQQGLAAEPQCGECAGIREVEA